MQRYPLTWPAGWPRRTDKRTAARFSTAERRLGESWTGRRDVTVADAIQRCRAEIPGHEHMAESERPRCGQYTTVALPLCQHCGREHGAVNPGVEAARLAAHALGGTWIKPAWPAEGLA